MAQINLSKANVRLIRHHGKPGAASHVLDIEVTQGGLSRRKAMRMLLPAAMLGFLLMPAQK